MQESNYHTKTKEEIFKELATSEKGLSSQEATKRLKEKGFNELPSKKRELIILKFLKQFNSPLIYILFIAMIISFVFGHLLDAYVILGVVLINATIGFIQEKKAEHAIEALKKMIVSYSKVYRDNQLIKIPAKELIPGDVIFLESGDKISADARLIEIQNFKTQEASLTGESLSQEKSLSILEETISLGDRTNMVFMGTMAVTGTAKAVVVSTASQTAIGKIAESIKKVIQPKMHFNQKVHQLSIQMALFALIGASLTFLIGYFYNKLEFFDIFLFTIASLVSGIPEGLPAVLVIVLAIGSWRMAKKNAVIRHLPAVETLGVATVIATDKTGTLTQNSMTIEKVLTSDSEFSVTGNGWEPLGRFYKDKNPIKPFEDFSLKKLLSISLLSNKSNLVRKQGEYEIVGDPTEVALLVLAKKIGVEKEELLKKDKVIEDLPFTSESKFRASLIELTNKKRELYSIGAFETIIKRSSKIYKDSKAMDFNEKEKKEFLKKAIKLARQGYRILALSYKEFPYHKKTISRSDVEKMVFVGIVAMKDPPRKNVKDAIKRARNAGIRIIMKTGDHKETAIAIAKEIGLANSKSKVFTGRELQALSEEEFSRVVREVDIFARVPPNMKMKIITELQKQGEIVAMTGDGVNDAPALKKADIGVAMGIIGTDVARESSEMVLTDDNFTSIVNAIEEGRIVFQNVRQTSTFLVSHSVAEHITIIASLLLKFPLPLLPVHILYLNLVTCSVIDVTLAMEPGHHDVLNQKPRNKKEKILNKEVLPFILLTSFLMMIGTLPLFFYYLPQGIIKARTIAFMSMAMFQLFNVFNLRSMKKSLFEIGFFSNKWLALGWLGSFIAMLIVIYLPFINKIFQFTPITFLEFLMITAITSTVFIAGEIYKKIRYRN